MTAGYYTSGPERAEKVRRLFDRIARRYDLINDLQSFGLHRLWKRKLAGLAGDGSRHTALDLCCGTGDIGRLFSECGFRTVGCDFSAQMLMAAPQSNQRQSFVQGDALRIPFRAETFDVVTISYGLRNLADFRAGLMEMVRVSKPNAHILILDFGRPANLLWRTIYFAYLRLIVPIFGLLFTGDAAAYRYILESLEHYPAQRGVAQLLEQIGCRQVIVHNLLGGMMSIHSARAPVCGQLENH